jgi:hypothetical protein
MKTLIAATLILLASLMPAPAQLDNDCALVATEAFAKISPYAVWSKMLKLSYINLHDKQSYGHVMFCFQPFKGAPIMLYDNNGTIILTTRQHNAAVIAKELGEAVKDDLIITYAAFVE